MGEIVARPATKEVWPDVVELLSARGSVKGCWCMFFRQNAQEWHAGRGEPNRRALEELVEAGAETGLVAYRDGTPVGWVSVAPRADYARLDRSPVSKRVDDLTVWSLVCLYVGRAHRGGGVARALVRAALDHAAARGAEVVEAYPVDDTMGPVGSDDAYHGWVSLLRDEGFQEVARRTPRRPVMRLSLAARNRTRARTRAGESGAERTAP